MTRGAETFRLFKWLKFIILCVTIGFSILHLLSPIIDNDFFWHLKTGEWIWDYKSLPERDPFAYTTEGVDTPRARFVLKGFWVSQVTYHLIFDNFGLEGIILFRFVVAFALFSFMLTSRKKEPLYYYSIFLIFAITILGIYPLDRPQVLTFVFFSALLYLLRKMSDGIASRCHYLCLPFMMVFWANVHPGYVLGIIVTLLFIVMEGVKYPLKKFVQPPIGNYKFLCISGFTAIVLSFLNPNSYQALLEIMLPKPDALFNTEYLTVLEALKAFRDYHFAVYLFVLAATALVVTFRQGDRTRDITEMALLLGLGYFSFTSIRYIAFFLIAAFPFLAGMPLGGRIMKLSKGIICALAICMGIFSIWQDRVNINSFKRNAWVHDYVFPVKAAEYILENNIQGNMYNYWPWGGYLMWKFAPERKVFFDGRHLSYEIFEQTRLIDNADNTVIFGLSSWRTYLEIYKVRYVISPRYYHDGSIVPLVAELLQDWNWEPVFSDHLAIIFVKKSN